MVTCLTHGDGVGRWGVGRRRWRGGRVGGAKYLGGEGLKGCKSFIKSVSYSQVCLLKETDYFCHNLGVNVCLCNLETKYIPNIENI